MKKVLPIILILLIAFVLRFYKLNSYPALNADEAAIGYNAYSLIQTGQDEHGNSWPIHFESFGDFKPGLYFYLALPFIKILGLNEWSVRLPGAFLGLLTVYLVYLLTNALFANKKIKVWNLDVGIITGLLLAISPWHIHFSRGAWEVNVSTFFITLGLYSFIRTIKNSGIINYIFFVVSFALSLYTYHSARLIVPLLGLGILIIYRENVRKQLKQWIIATLLGLILLVPLAKEMLSPAGISRASGVSIFADPGIVARINEQRGKYQNPSGFLPKALHNKPIYYSIEFIENWLGHFSPKFLFISGDEIQRNKVPSTGQMYLFDILFIGIGIIVLLKSKIINNKSKYLVSWFLIISPVAAALTFQSPHALRAQIMVIPLIMISGLGLFTILEWLEKQKRIVIFIGSLALIVMITCQFIKYEKMYWYKMAKSYPFSSQYGVKELVSYVAENESSYERIIVTDRYDQPYILFLFYMKYPPSVFQGNHELTKRDKFGFSTVKHFDKYYFETIDYNKLADSKGSELIVGTDEEIPREVNIIKEIYGSNGYKYFEVTSN